jgi:uncharacterized Zn-finger protein
MPYCSCFICGKGFTRVEHLKRHARIHTGELPYKCGFSGCGRTTSRRDNLQQHLKTHNVPPEEMYRYIIQTDTAAGSGSDDASGDASGDEIIYDSEPDSEPDSETLVAQIQPLQPLQPLQLQQHLPQYHLAPIEPALQNFNTGYDREVLCRFSMEF